MNHYAFATIRGVQAGRAYYVAMVPLRVVERLFRFDEEDVPPEFRAQRNLNKARIPSIARYICDHSREYVLSALAASIDGGFRFEPSSDTGVNRSLGSLIVDMRATILINDGQHRRAAIVEALRERPNLGDETIAVTIFPDEGLARSQQMFVDLNQHAVKPARSLRLLYDGRDEGARLSRAVADGIPLLRDLTDFSRSNLGASSRKLFAFSNLHTAIATLIAETHVTASPDCPDEVIAFWEAVIAEMRDWQLAGDGRIAASELRRDKIHAHGVALEAIAIAGARLGAARPGDWGKALQGLGAIDWSRKNSAMWEGRAMLNGRINRSRTSVLLTADAIFRSVGQMGADEAAQLS